MGFGQSEESKILSMSEGVKTKTETTIRDVLLPINQYARGPLEQNADKRTPFPFVFLLGNHSSGKSSFINHLLQRKVQEAGVAPTDDGFTIITAGDEDSNRDGPTLIGDPDMGFSGLRVFGPNLIHHVNLKIRQDLALHDIMLIDSPGMIDSPTDSISYVGSGQGRRDRGYDFEGVTRWLAERADVILLFFDPDKPGTTGETLSVLTNSLAGMDHKLHIILNKVDQFEKIHDFARAYGSLCWNLSKVIPRKDIPRIYTMCTPISEKQGKRPDYLPDKMNLKGKAWAASLADLEATRLEVEHQVSMAPERRVDNMITQLYDSASLLQMHIVVMEAIRAEYQQQRKKFYLLAGGVGVFGNTVSLAALYMVPTIWGFSATLSLSSLLGAAGVFLYGNHVLGNVRTEMASEENLERLFSRLYVHEVAEGNEFVKALWIRVKRPLKGTLETVGIANLNRVSSRDFNALEKVINETVPSLRRDASYLTKQKSKSLQQEVDQVVDDGNWQRLNYKTA